MDKSTFPVVTNSGDWCKLAREEDDRNVLYANFTFELDNHYINKEMLELFDAEIKKFTANENRLEEYETASSYLAAAKETELPYMGNEISFPEDGVARVVNFHAFWKEYQSFLSGITSNAEEAMKIHSLRTSEPDTDETLNNILKSALSLLKAEQFALQHHIKALQETEKAAIKLPPISINDVYLDGDRITWVTRKEALKEELSKPGNKANRACRILGLHYVKPLIDYGLIYYVLIYNVSDQPVNLNKPTIFSMGYEDAYCAAGGQDGWGRTAESMSGQPGLPEAVIRRGRLMNTSSRLLGIIDLTSTPEIGSPSMEVISKRLNHVTGARHDCDKTPCNRLSIYFPTKKCE